MSSLHSFQCLRYDPLTINSMNSRWTFPSRVTSRHQRLSRRTSYTSPVARAGRRSVAVNDEPVGPFSSIGLVG